jgi:hypothetical protein
VKRRNKTVKRKLNIAVGSIGPSGQAYIRALKHFSVSWLDTSDRGMLLRVGSSKHFSGLHILGSTMAPYNGAQTKRPIERATGKNCFRDK